MKKTRRQCFKTGVRSTLLLSTAALTGSGSKGVSPEENLDLEMKPLGYGRSFICHEAPENSVRFWVESRTRILDDQAGRWADYYQCGFCKSGVCCNTSGGVTAAPLYPIHNSSGLKTVASM